MTESMWGGGTACHGCFSQVNLGQVVTYYDTNCTIHGWLSEPPATVRA